eukprot:gene12368-15553_t
MVSAAQERLLEERKQWRRNYPYGFVAKPVNNADGSLNFLCWKCLIPGKKETPWAGGKYPLDLIFPESYPSQPPVALFPPAFLHPNVFPSGKTPFQGSVSAIYATPVRIFAA